MGRGRSPKRVKAAAYLYASEGAPSPEITKLQRIERFGLEAVTGRRVFLHGEYVRLMYAESIVLAYRSRDQAASWAAWASDNLQAAQMLHEIEELCH